jgi:hypothetical protein
MIKLILNISFMCSGCLGALDMSSNGMENAVDHDYDTLPPSTPDARIAAKYTRKIQKY